MPVETEPTPKTDPAHPIKIDPTHPVAVVVDIRGNGQPILAAYQLWYKNPDDIISTPLGRGTDSGPDAGTSYPFQQVLGAGSQIAYYALLTASGGNQPFTMALNLQQLGQPLPGGTITLTGVLVDEQHEVVQGKIDFVV